MITRGTGTVGYNVQTAVDAQHHLIVDHQVTNIGSDRGQLATMATRARAAMQVERLDVVADRGYFTGEEIVACEEAGITAYVPRPQTSNNQARGLFGKRDFVYVPETGTYRCPAGQSLTWRFSTVEKGLTLHCYWSSVCKGCPLKAQCTPSPQRRVKRWEHDALIDAMQQRLDQDPDKMRIRRQTVEQPLRHPQSMDGVDALPDAHAETCQHGNEPARACLQPQARDAHPGNRATDAGDGRLSAPSSESDVDRRACRAFGIKSRLEFSEVKFSRQRIWTMASGQQRAQRHYFVVASIEYAFSHSLGRKQTVSFAR